MELPSMIDPLAKLPRRTWISGWLTAIVVIVVLVVHFSLLLWARKATHEPDWVDHYADFWSFSWASEGS